MNLQAQITEVLPTAEKCIHYRETLYVDEANEYLWL